MHYLAASLVILCYIFFCGFCWRHYRRQQPGIIPAHQQANNFRQSNSLQQPNSLQQSNSLLIGYASQTGKAMQFALQTAHQLLDSNIPAQVLPLNQISSDLLRSTSRFLVVASTYGEGEAPDNANRFISRTLASLDNNSLTHLQIGLLALGDSSYQQFCGFAHELQRQLHYRGATSLFDMIEVDNLDESALRHWQYYLGQLSGNSHFSDWINPTYGHWQLVSRQQLNPGSPGAPAYHLKLNPLGGAIIEDAWQVGDIVEIGPCNSQERIENFLRALGRTDVSAYLLSTKALPDTAADYEILRKLDEELLVDKLAELPHREYSIASIPTEQSLDLLVRQVRDSHQVLGLGSGWLTVHALLYSPIRLRIRSNPHFHAPALDKPLILIGNGTGIAGLRAHIAWRARIFGSTRAAPKTWLFFGERTSAYDYFFADDIEAWYSGGVLTRLDVVFSRDAKLDEPRYVQDLLLIQAAEIHAWVSIGAAIYVCGSLAGMAQSVDESLARILGEPVMESLVDQGRYRRDVY